MSGRDRDVGRKWESGSAKRKRKAERTASNQVLSLNMMKFLNQTASGSTKSIDSTSTLQTSEIPLENALDALNTESECQLDVEFGLSSSQSKYDAETFVLSSSNQEEQIDIDYPIRNNDASAIVQQVLVNSDPGFWTFPITDSQRRDIVQRGPIQQINSGDECYPKASRENEGDSRGYRSAEEQARELARSIRREVAKLADKWNTLVDRSDAWGRCLDDAVQEAVTMPVNAGSGGRITARPASRRAACRLNQLANLNVDVV
ncbi:unnamed protein product [Spodoptera littoralis]|uniref:Uncharacterized protein n=1 Tax=Spodoptera littoralis TaxID=7109 RepID=A0A9P0HXY6_SPOLI|nr:unnamed protein product [Spodoptera littoralis]CAH1636240.1 unnamed protein product [Spodoptera littoralis]